MWTVHVLFLSNQWACYQRRDLNLPNPTYKTFPFPPLILDFPSPSVSKAQGTLIGEYPQYNSSLFFSEALILSRFQIQEVRGLDLLCVGSIWADKKMFNKKASKNSHNKEIVFYIYHSSCCLHYCYKVKGTINLKTTDHLGEMSACNYYAWCLKITGKKENMFCYSLNVFTWRV